MKIFRKEHFGGILYDTETLRFKLMDKDVTLIDNTSIDKIISKELPERTDIVSSPVRIYFELTQKCNLSCKHCFASSNKNSYEGLDINEFKKILDDFDDNGVIDVRFTGGEPTTKEGWFDLLKYAKDLGFAVSLNTNGVYDNPNLITNQLADLDLEQVTISIDGLKKNHEYMRGTGSFDKAIDSIKLMKKKGVKIRFNTVITKKNVNEIPDLVEIANLYASEINFFYMRPVGRAVKHNSLSLDFYEHFESAKSAISLRKKYPNLSIMHFEQSLTERSIKNANSFNSLLSALPYCNTTLNLASNGSLWPHGYTTYQDERFNLGNLLNDSLRNIWLNSSKIDGLRMWYRDIMARCDNCNEYMKKCAGFNFEMEIAKITKSIKDNNFCISQSEVPNLFGGKYL